MNERPKRLHFADWRCDRCRRLLARVDRSAIRDGETVAEIRCVCKHVNYLADDLDERDAA